MIKILLKITLLLFFLCAKLSFGQGSVCADVNGENGADPFCSTTGVLFPNCHGGSPECTRGAEFGPDYGCLLDQPFPAWYYLQIEDSGSLTFSIVQTANEDGTGSQLDVDFICYGPFVDPVTPCTTDLIAENIIDCSFDPRYDEIMTIPNAVSGEYYLVLITNYSEYEGFISFRQTSGNGSTDCSILEAVLGPNQHVCGFAEITLDGATEEAVSYEWYFFNEVTQLFEVIQGETNPTYIVANEGKYQLLIKDAEGNSETDEIIITYNDIPVIENRPLDITLCEVSAGSAEFNFTNNTSLILGSQNPEEFLITYYLSQEDADQKQNVIPETYATTATTIFARIENVNLESCYATTSFELFINLAPDLSNDVYGFTICENLDNTPNQGTLMISEIQENLVNEEGDSVLLLEDEESLTSQDVTISYYRSVSDAVLGINSINDGDLIGEGEIIFMKVQNNQSIDPTGCFNTDSIAEIHVAIGQIPEVNTVVSDLVECAISVEDQDAAIFDLTQKNTDVSVSNNPIGSQVFYYASQSDFDDGVFIDNPSDFQNYINPQSIIGAVIDSTRGCEILVSTRFDLRVEALPTLTDGNAFLGIQKVCVFSDGTVQENIMLGEDIGAIDGETYIYDWTPDNVDADNDGNEDAIYFIDNLSDKQEYSVEITRVNSSGRGVICSNAINPETMEDYSFTLIPTATPESVGFEIKEPSFSGNYTITALPEISIGDLSDLEYSLDDGVSYQDSAVFYDVPVGDYVIVVRNKFGCLPIEIRSELIQLLDFPLFFTPNGDRVHDTWNIINLEDQAGSALIYIFDRHGKLLKQLRSNAEGWDGTYNGVSMPSSEYWFRVEFNEPGDPNMRRRVFTGSFSLIR